MKNPKNKKIKRNNQLVKQFESENTTFEKLAEEYNITRQRAHQIVKASKKH